MTADDALRGTAGWRGIDPASPAARPLGETDDDADGRADLRADGGPGATGSSAALARADSIGAQPALPAALTIGAERDTSAQGERTIDIPDVAADSMPGLTPVERPAANAGVASESAAGLISDEASAADAGAGAGPATVARTAGDAGAAAGPATVASSAADAVGRPTAVAGPAPLERSVADAAVAPVDSRTVARVLDSDALRGARPSGTGRDEAGGDGPASESAGSVMLARAADGAAAIQPGSGLRRLARVPAAEAEAMVRAARSRGGRQVLAAAPPLNDDDDETVILPAPTHAAAAIDDSASRPALAPPAAEIDEPLAPTALRLAKVDEPPTSPAVRPAEAVDGPLTTPAPLAVARSTDATLAEALVRTADAPLALARSTDETFAEALARSAAIAAGAPGSPARGGTPPPPPGTTTVELARDGGGPPPATPATPITVPPPPQEPAAPEPLTEPAMTIDELYDELSSRLRRELLEERERQGDLLAKGPW